MAAGGAVSMLSFMAWITSIMESVVLRSVALLQKQAWIVLPQTLLSRGCIEDTLIMILRKGVGGNQDLSESIRELSWTTHKLIPFIDVFPGWLSSHHACSRSLPPIACLPQTVSIPVCGSVSRSFQEYWEKSSLLLHLASVRKNIIEIVLFCPSLKSVQRIQGCCPG